MKKWLILSLTCLSTFVYAAQFECGKRTCKQMDSCAEARYHLEQCGVKSLDRDKDGVPCESICGSKQKK